ncbi:TetR/AcrR family transcriptional regulator [Arthrobacter sp. NA-172]|uniref:TetR/AcrR family transcriptional regulator n=1 Tax=Arthrobacter sp. NA-172 TaxID=3367524 RepID=UPI0037548FD4
MSQNVRDAMIEAAWLLIAERGLEGMATREVLARTGAPRGSVYHHFPRGRTELIEAAIEHSIEWMSDQIALISPKGPADVVRGYFDIWRRILEATDFKAGCAVAGVVIGGNDANMLDRGAVAFAASIDALVGLFARVGVPVAEARQRSTLLVAAAEGAVLLARAQRSTGPLIRIADQLANTN